MRRSNGDSPPQLIASFDGAWHLVDPEDGQTRELIGCDGLDLEQVQAHVTRLYADTLAGKPRRPEQRRLL